LFRRGDPGLERRDRASNSGNSAVGLLSSAVSGAWLELRSQVRYDSRPAGRHSKAGRIVAGVLPPRTLAACRLRVLQLPQAIIEIARVDCPQEAFDHLRQREPLDAAAPDRVGDGLYRAKDIGGRASSTERSRRGATVRSRQSRKAVGSPARASSTALRLSAVASPSSK
jgi:hypothetical protein